MSRTALAGTLLLSCALAFALGHQLGAGREPEPPSRARTGVTPPSPRSAAAKIHVALLKPDALERAAELARVLGELEQAAEGDVWDAYGAVVLDVGDVEWALLGQWWAHSDPAAALRWAFTQQEANPLVVTAILRTWASRDPEAALRAFYRQVAPRRDSLVPVAGQALVRGWEESGRPGLEDFLAAMPNNQHMQAAVGILARRKVLRDGPEAGFRWAEAIPDDEPGTPERLKVNAMRRTATAAVEVDPEKAAAFAAEHGEERHGVGMYRRVGVRRAELGEAEAALDWLSTLPAGSQRESAVGETFRTWMLNDREASVAWLRAAEKDGEFAAWLDPAVRVYAVSLTRQDPEEALAWAARIRAEDRRRQTRVNVLVTWRDTDPVAAQAWLDQSDLTPGDREWVERIQKLRDVNRQKRARARKVENRPAAPSPAPD
jgi:hypothetical protein